MSEQAQPLATAPQVARLTFRSLDSGEVVKTTEALRERIATHFPDASLLHVVDELVQIARETRQRAAQFAQPIILLRLGLALILITFVVLLGFAIADLTLSTEPTTLSELLQGLEAGTNEVILLGAGALFLISVEGRIKRSRGLRALHELRSIAHIIDLHQLTKDPARLEPPKTQLGSPQPQPSYDACNLSRYLDYCSEMLSLIGKIAALYAQEMRDPILLEAVDGIEALTSGASRKIWQKIMIIQEHYQAQARAM